MDDKMPPIMQGVGMMPLLVLASPPPTAPGEKVPVIVSIAPFIPDKEFFLAEAIQILAEELKKLHAVAKQAEGPMRVEKIFVPEWPRKL